MADHDVKRHRAMDGVHKGRMGHLPETGAQRHGKSSKKRLAQLCRDDPSWSDTDTGGRGQWQRASYRRGQDRLTGKEMCEHDAKMMVEEMAYDHFADEKRYYEEIKN